MTGFPAINSEGGTRRGNWDWILDHNPLYLLSAALMLLGCYLLATALDVRAGDMSKLLLVLGTMNAYEFLLIGLGIYLWKKRGIVRDGAILLLIEGLFLADLTFLNAEASAADVVLGAWVNGGMLVLALVKMGLVVWGLPMEKSARMLGFVGLELAMLCGLPVLLRGISEAGMIGPRPFYGLWWAVGLLPVVYDVLGKWKKGATGSGAKDGVRVAWTVLPWVGLVAHLGFQHWVYRAPFYLTEVAPVLVGLIVVVGRLPRWVAGNGVGLRVGLAVLALMLAGINPEELGLPMPGMAMLSPFVATVVSTGLALAYCAGLEMLAWTAGGLGLLVVVKLWGPGWRAVAEAIDFVLRMTGRVWDTLAWLVEKVLPTSAAGWGVVAVAGAFVALGAGVMVSLARGTRGVMKE